MKKLLMLTAACVFAAAVIGCSHPDEGDNGATGTTAAASATGTTTAAATTAVAGTTTAAATAGAPGTTTSAAAGTAGTPGAANEKKDAKMKKDEKAPAKTTG